MSRTRLLQIVVLAAFAALGAVMVSAQMADPSKFAKEGLENVVRRLLKSPSATVTCESAEVSLATEPATVSFKKVSIVDAPHKLEFKCESLKLMAPKEWLSNAGPTPGARGPGILQLDLEAPEITGLKDSPVDKPNAYALTARKADRIVLKVRDCDPMTAALGDGSKASTGIGAILDYLSADNPKDTADLTRLPLSDQSAVLTIYGIKPDLTMKPGDVLEVASADLDRMLRLDKMVVHADYRSYLKELEIRLPEVTAPTGQSSGAVTVQYRPDAQSFADMPAKVTVALKSEGRQDPPVKWTVKTGPDRKVAFSIGNSSFDCKVDIELDRNGRPVILPRGYLSSKVGNFAFQEIEQKLGAADTALIRELAVGKMELLCGSMEDQIRVRLDQEKLNFKDVQARIETTLGAASIGLQAKMGLEEFRSPAPIFAKCPFSVDISLAGAKLAIPAVAALLSTAPDIAMKVAQIDEAKIKSSFDPRSSKWTMDVEQLSGPLFALAGGAKARFAPDAFKIRQEAPGPWLLDGSARLELDLHPGGSAFGDPAKTGSYALNKGSVQADIDYDSHGSTDFALNGLRMRAAARLDSLKALFAGPMKQWLRSTPLAKLDMADTGQLDVNDFQAFADLDNGNLQVFRTKFAGPALTATLNAEIDLDAGAAANSKVTSSQLRLSSFNEKIKAYLQGLAAERGGPLPTDGDAVLLEATGPVNKPQFKGFPGKDQ